MSNDSQQSANATSNDVADPVKLVRLVWTKETEHGRLLHRMADEIERLTACFDGARREWEIAAQERDRLRAALSALLHNVETIGLNGVSIEHPHVCGVAMAREALSGKHLPDETTG